MDNILGKTETITAAIEEKRSDLEKKKLEALEARKLEQVHVSIIIVDLRAST